MEINVSDQGNFRSAFSIKSVKKVPSQQQTVLGEDILDDSKNVASPQPIKSKFDQQKLQGLWQAFIKKKREEKEMAIASHLSINEPYFQDETVFYKVPSDAIKHVLDQVKQELKGALSEGKEINVPITFVVEESKKNEKQFFTSQEKLERLVEINPNIKVLIDKLNLRF